MKSSSLCGPLGTDSSECSSIFLSLSGFNMASMELLSFWQSSSPVGIESIGKPLEVFLELSRFGVIENRHIVIVGNFRSASLSKILMHGFRL